MAGKFQIAPIEGQKFVEEGGHLSEAARRWIELIPPALTSPAHSGTVPPTSASQGIGGQLATDGNFLYVCVGTNQWKRLALSAF
ncbi:MAG TPA: hypothetical protein VFF58_00675 [Candidatus Nitrosotalea sp.]|nr:hypothetical protein [Candidatus Nitrosotalea sp.]